MSEFLPLCDLVFNVVSLGAYFCNVLFDLLFVYSLYLSPQHRSLFTQCSCTLATSSILIQITSLHWYLSRTKQQQKCPTVIFKRCLVVALHLCQWGILWRYTLLLVPITLTDVKRHVRDLCILRLLHAFVQSVPMLLLQLSLLPPWHPTAPSNTLFTVAASLSLFSICWSLASFSKHVQQVDRLVLTWLGVVSQLLWRGGTVSARMIALSAYAATYHSWIFLVLSMHWLCMLLWLLSPSRSTHTQSSPTGVSSAPRKVCVCMLVAIVYVLAYVNLQDRPHARAMAIFYVVMLLENCLLVLAVWPMQPTFYPLIPLLTVALFTLGIIFMVLYYRFFHVSRMLVLLQHSKTQADVAPPAGVFNCRLAGMPPNRKKKKPSRFVPPPMTNAGDLPFWKRPLPSSYSDTGSSVGSRPNIHQKLQQKKEKQLAELKMIEEEIKQGKLLSARDLPHEQPVLKPIPNAKRHQLNHDGMVVHRRPAPKVPRCATPELVLAPRYLDHFECDCGALSISALAIESPMQSSAVGFQMSNNGPQHAHVASTTSLADDLDSQLSLPRSFTLPRQFKYYNGYRNRMRPNPPPLRRQHHPQLPQRYQNHRNSGGDYFHSSQMPTFTLSNNSSSDGDVDSIGSDQNSQTWNQCFHNHHQYLQRDELAAMSNHAVLQFIASQQRVNEDEIGVIASPNELSSPTIRKPFRHETKL